MGYTTDFRGSFNITPPLTFEQVAYLIQFAKTRRMKRDAEKTATRPDILREAVGLPVGVDGAYFVGEEGVMGQGAGPDVLDGNNPPGSPTRPPYVGKGGSGAQWEKFYREQELAKDHPDTQPSLWCQWVPTEDGAYLQWDGGEKFYEYVRWLKYLIRHFFIPWGRTLNGEVDWQGEESDDIGRIRVTDNVVQVGAGIVIYDFDDA